jgi:hypothetical protein
MDHDWFWVQPPTTLPFLQQVQTHQQKQQRTPPLFLKELQEFRFILPPKPPPLLLKEIQEFRFKVVLPPKPPPLLLKEIQDFRFLPQKQQQQQPVTTKKFRSFIVLACILRINR